MLNVRRRETCRLCDSPRLRLILSLAPTPPANAFVSDESSPVHDARYPLDVFFCEVCSHLQLLAVLDPSALFEEYLYVSGTSQAFLDHFEAYARDVVARFDLAPESLVVEIGSNDGSLLGYFQQQGMRVLGVDPARAIAAEATRAGIPTLAEFFTPEVAEKIRADHGSASAVVANNVLAHIDDLATVVRSARDILQDDGILVFEVSYLRDVYEKRLFDTIYHEHLDYHSVKPLRSFMAAVGMELFAAQRVASHGGSLRGFAQLAGGPHPSDGSVDQLIADEERIGLDRPETFQTFGSKIEALGNELKELIAELKADGKTIAGYGAPAKATTLLHHFGIDAGSIEFIVDDNPLKQGRLVPGLRIPILHSRAIEERRPDFLMVLAWNFADSIISKERSFSEHGGRFIVPLPEVRVT